jgi:hypothetical protein
MNDKYICTKCGTFWRLNQPDEVQPEGSWSLYDSEQKPEQCCDNSVDFLSVIKPVGNKAGII